MTDVGADGLSGLRAARLAVKVLNLDLDLATTLPLSMAASTAREREQKLENVSRFTVPSIASGCRFLIGQNVARAATEASRGEREISKQLSMVVMIAKEMPLKWKCAMSRLVLVSVEMRERRAILFLWEHLYNEYVR